MPLRTASPAATGPHRSAGTFLPPVLPAGYRGLKVWQRAMDLVASVHRLTKSFPDDEQALRDDLLRSAMAVPAQIAAGNALHQRGEYARHLTAAHAAATRVECLLQLSDRLGVLAARDTMPLVLLAADVSRLLRTLVRATPPALDDAETAVN